MTTTRNALPQDRETSCRWAIRVGEWRCRWAFDRSNEVRAEDGIGQDFAVFAHGDSWLAFAVCDGVGKSYRGDVAARILGDALVEWLAHLPEERSSAPELTQKLRRDLDELAVRAQEAVDAIPMPESAGAMLREVLERKRDGGSQAVFVAGRIDAPSRELPGGRVAVFWLGDACLRVWVAGREPGAREREVTLDGAFDTADRWSAPGGVLGNGPFGAVHDLRDPAGTRLTRILAYSDGLKVLNARKAPLTMAGIDALIEECRLDVNNDDASVVEIFAVPPPPRVEAPLGPPPNSPIVEVDGGSLVIAPFGAKTHTGVVWVKGMIPATHRVPADGPLILDPGPGNYEVRLRTWAPEGPSAWSEPTQVAIASPAGESMPPEAPSVVETVPSPPSMSVEPNLRLAAETVPAQDEATVPYEVDRAMQRLRNEALVPMHSFSMAPFVGAAGLLLVVGAALVFGRPDTVADDWRERAMSNLESPGSTSAARATSSRPHESTASDVGDAPLADTIAAITEALATATSTEAPSPSPAPSPTLPIVLEQRGEVRVLSPSRNGGVVAASWSSGDVCMWWRADGASSGTECRTSRARAATSGAIALWGAGASVIVALRDGSLEAFGRPGSTLPSLPEIRVPGKGEVTVLSTSPSGTMLAIGTDTPELTLWSGADYRTIVVPPDIAELGAIRRLAWSADGMWLAVLFDDSAALLTVEDARWGAPMLGVLDVAFAPDGRLARLGEFGVEVNELKAAEAGSGQTSIVRGMPGTVTSIAFWGDPPSLYGFPASDSKRPGMWKAEIAAVQTDYVEINVPEDVEVAAVSWAADGVLVVADSRGGVWVLPVVDPGDGP